jgi:hypothetical protein
MSLLSTLALVLLPALRPKPPQERLSDELLDTRIRLAELEVDNAWLRRENDELRDDLSQARSERDAVRDEIERLWRAREFERAHPLIMATPQPAGPDFRPQEVAARQAEQWIEQQHQLARYAQAQCQQAQYAQQAQMQQMQNPFYGQLAFQQGLGQMAGLQQSAYHDCTCVPDRARALGVR